MKRRVPVIAGVLVALVLVGWYVAFWRPAGARLHAAQTATATARAKQGQLDLQLAGLHKLQRALPGVQTALNASEAALPSAPSIDDLIDQISVLCEQNSITWTDESQAVSGSASSTSDQGSTVVALTLGVSGSYGNMVDFVSALQHLPRLIVVDSLAYDPGTGTSVTVTMAARAFADSTPIPSLSKAGTST